jgi:glucose-6-phosphate 1-dehydrogenase
MFASETGLSDCRCAAGKALNETKTEVRVQFKSKAGFFGRDADGYRNELVMQLAPKNVMYLKIVVKKPGLGMELGMSELNLSYHERCDYSFGLVLVS